MKGFTKYLECTAATLLISLIFTLSVTLVQYTIDAIVFNGSVDSMSSYRNMMIMEIVSTLIALGTLCINYKRNPKSKLNDLIPKGLADIMD